MRQSDWYLILAGSIDRQSASGVYRSAECAGAHKRGGAGGPSRFPRKATSGVARLVLIGSRTEDRPTMFSKDSGRESRRNCGSHHADLQGTGHPDSCRVLGCRSSCAARSSRRYCVRHRCRPGARELSQRPGGDQRCRAKRRGGNTPGIRISRRKRRICRSGGGCGAGVGRAACPSVIALLGDKVAAKRAAVRAGVPVVPGYAGN